MDQSAIPSTHRMDSESFQFAPQKISKSCYLDAFFWAKFENFDQISTQKPISFDRLFRSVFFFFWPRPRPNIIYVLEVVHDVPTPPFGGSTSWIKYFFCNPADPKTNVKAVFLITFQTIFFDATVAENLIYLNDLGKVSKICLFFFFIFKKNQNQEFWGFWAVLTNII